MPNKPMMSDDFHPLSSAHRRMWNATNSFIVNLSLADLMNSFFNTVLSFTFMKSG